MLGPCLQASNPPQPRSSHHHRKADGPALSSIQQALHRAWPTCHGAGRSPDPLEQCATPHCPTSCQPSLPHPLRTMPPHGMAPLTSSGPSPIHPHSSHSTALSHYPQPWDCSKASAAVLPSMLIMMGMAQPQCWTWQAHAPPSIPSPALGTMHQLSLAPTSTWASLPPLPHGWQGHISQCGEHGRGGGKEPPTNPGPFASCPTGQQGGHRLIPPHIRQAIG